jgi:hypothetical protein
VSSDNDRSYVEAARRGKRAALEALGIGPFAYRFDRSHTAAAALAAYQDSMGEDGPLVAVAGRIVRLSSQGKTMFAHLEDPSGRIQVYLRRDVLGDLWRMVELLDLDDHVLTTKPTPNRGDCLSILGIAREISALTGSRLRVPAVALLLFALVPVLSIRDNLRLLPDVRRFARHTDDMDAFLRTQTGHAAVLRNGSWALNPLILGPQPEFWVNRCVSSYYGLESLQVTR